MGESRLKADSRSFMFQILADDENTYQQTLLQSGTQASLFPADTVDPAAQPRTDSRAPDRTNELGDGGSRRGDTQKSICGKRFMASIVLHH